MHKDIKEYVEEESEDIEDDPYPSHSSSERRAQKDLNMKKQNEKKAQNFIFKLHQVLIKRNLPIFISSDTNIK